MGASSHRTPAPFKDEETEAGHLSKDGRVVDSWSDSGTKLPPSQSVNAMPRGSGGGQWAQGRLGSSLQLREGKDRRGLWWGQGLVRSGLPRCQLPATLSSEGSFGSRLPQSPAQLLPTAAARLPGKMSSRLVAWSRGFPCYDGWSWDADSLPSIQTT